MYKKNDFVFAQFRMCRYVYHIYDMAGMLRVYIQLIVREGKAMANLTNKEDLIDYGRVRKSQFFCLVLAAFNG